MTKEEFSGLLDGLLHRERLSVAEVAKRLGCGASTVFAWLDRKNPKMPNGRNLIKLAKALNAPELAVSNADLNDELVEKLVAILDLLRDGVSPLRATERVKPDLSPECRERLAESDDPAVRGLVSAALPPDWEKLSPADQAAAVRPLAEAVTEGYRQASE